MPLAYTSGWTWPNLEHYQVRLYQTEGAPPCFDLCTTEKGFSKTIRRSRHGTA